MTESPCEVTWCAAIATRGRYCAIHFSRPVKPRESQEDWLIRLRAEDKKAEKAAEKKKLADAAAARSKAGKGGRAA